MISRPAAFISLLLLLPAGAEVLVPSGSATEWRYAVSGPSDGWRKGDFDDSAWQKGPAPLGYGEENLGTEIAPSGKSGDQTLTAWFRTSFQVRDSAALEKSLTLSLRADDGAAVYLNGTEIARFNLPAKAEPDTMATRQLGSREELLVQKFRIKPGTLQMGPNCLAVEVHQASADSSDLVLDLALRADTAWPEIKATITDSSREATMAYYRDHFIPPGMKVPDGYVDGGRRMIVGKNAAVASSREILVIDRSKDPALRHHLEMARDTELLKLPVEARARLIARYVDKVLSPGGDRSAALQAVEEFTTGYANRPVLFGEMEEVCQSGVCRHRALLFKMLCDEAGLRAALVRGNYNGGLTTGGHAWNELLLEDGSRVIVDVMNPSPDFAFLPETSPEAKAYVSVKDEIIYPRAAPAGQPAKPSAEKRPD